MKIINIAFILGFISCSAIHCKPHARAKEVRQVFVNEKPLNILGIRHVDLDIINKILEEYKTAREIKWALLNTQYFSKVQIVESNNAINIRVKEYPILHTISVETEGEYSIPKELIKLLPVTKGAFLSENNLTSIKAAVESYYQSTADTKNISIELYQKTKKGISDIRVMVKIIKDKPISQIIITGNKELEGHKLRQCIATTVKSLYPVPLIKTSTLNRENLDKTKLKLTEFAQKRGYLDFKVESINLEYSPKGEILSILVNEGPKHILSAVEVENNYSDLTEKEIQSIVRYNLGSVVRPDYWFRVTTKLNRLLVERNILNYEAKLDFANLPDEDKSAADSQDNIKHTKVIIKINSTDKILKIRNLYVLNNTFTNEQFILDTMRLYPEQNFNSVLLELAKERLLETQLFDGVTINIKEVRSNEYDVQVDLTEKRPVKAKANANVSSASDVTFGAQLNHENMDGNALNGSLQFQLVNLDPTVSVNLSRPFKGGNASTGYYDFTGLVSFSFAELNSSPHSLFKSNNIFDAIKDMLYNVHYKRISPFAYDIRDYPALKVDPSAELGKLKYPLSYNWDSNSAAQAIREYKTSLEIGAIFTKDAWTVTPSFTMSQRSFIYNIEESPDDTKIRKNTDFQHRENVDEAMIVALYEQEKDVADQTKLIVYQYQDGAMKNKVTQNLVIPKQYLTYLDLVEFADPKNKGIVKRATRGIGNSPVIDMSIKDKFEFIEAVKISYGQNDDLYEFGWQLFTNLQLILGTTQAAKVEIGGGMVAKLYDNLTLDLSLIYGKSFNNHYLDNFSPRDVGICKTMGPIETYRFTALGGNSMLKFIAKLKSDLPVNHSLTISPFLQFALGSLWDSGIKPERLPDQLNEKYGWKKDTLSIAQNDFHIVPILSPGVGFKFGPFNLELKLNLKIDDKNDKLNVVYPLDLSFSFG